MSVYINELSKHRAPARARKSRFWFHIILLLVIGSYLRAWSMMNESPSFDEAMAALIAAAPFTEYIGRVQPDFCPPVFYFFSHPVTNFRMSLEALRVVSIIAGALTPIALYLAGRRLYGEPAAVLAAYLLLLNPLHVYFSQEFQPSALFVLISIGGFFAMVRSAESNRWRDWLVYDFFAILLLHTQREAAFLVLTFPIIQLSRALFFPPVNKERRMHRFRLIQGVLFHHFIIIAVSIPWLWIMPNKLPWALPRPEASEILRIFSEFYLFGFTGWRPLSLWLTSLLLFALMLPPLLKTVRRMDFRTFAAIGVLILAIGLPFAYSQLETPRFLSEREGMTALPWFCLTLGILIVRCNWVIKSFLSALFSAVFLLATIQQARTLQKTATTDMLNTIIRDGASADDILAFWPGYTTALGDFWKMFYGKSFDVVGVSELLQTWADVPQDQPVYFVVSQFPADSAHLYTFQGALTQYSESEMLWQNRLNMVIKSENLDQKTLAQWYDEPRSLKILDQPTSNTQFIFTAADPAFKPKEEVPKPGGRSERQTSGSLADAKGSGKTAPLMSGEEWGFAYDRLDLNYDPTGHRFVWTTKPSVTLQLDVTLAPGRYLLRLHCSPDFDQPEYGRYKDRTVQLTLRSGEDQRNKIKLESAQTITLPFSTDVELHSLPVTITVDKMHKVPPPAGGSFGVKIYSISIDQEMEAESEF